MNQLKPQDLVKNLPEKFILVTAHRRENWGEPLKNIVLALDEILKEFEDFYVVFPVHPNPWLENKYIQSLKITRGLY